MTDINEDSREILLVHGLMPGGFDIKKDELILPWSGASMPLSWSVHLVQLAFDMLVPYNRIASRMGISNGTFHTQVRALGRLMKPFADDILKRILNCDTVMSDESHFTIDEARKESGGNGQFFWAISPGPASEDRSVRVLFTAGRTNETAMELLGGEDTHWTTLISDDLSEYGAVIKNTGRRHQLCMAHARRHLLKGMDPGAVRAYPDMVERWGYRGFLTGLDREYARPELGVETDSYMELLGRAVKDFSEEFKESSSCLHDFKDALSDAQAYHCVLPDDLNNALDDVEKHVKRMEMALKVMRKAVSVIKGGIRAEGL